MISLGIIVINIDRENDYYSDIARYGVKLGVKTYLFTPKNIDLIRKSITGFIYCNLSNDWKETTFTIPTYIYDRCFYQDEKSFKEQHPNVNWLKNQTSFIGYGLPNKWIVYKILEQDEHIKRYLPKTQLVQQPSDILSLLDHEKRVLIKPVSGSQGRGIVVFSKKNHHYSITFRKNKNTNIKIISKQKLNTIANKIINKRRYLLQPLLSLTDSTNHPFDLRVFVQKNEKGIWKEVGRGVRRGKSGDIISNLHGGGEVIPFKDWEKTLSEKETLNAQLRGLITRVPKLLEERLQPLFEVGLDFGIDQNQRLWLLEVNSKPGRNVIIENNVEQKTRLDRAPIVYCKYLAQQQGEKATL